MHVMTFTQQEEAEVQKMTGIALAGTHPFGLVYPKASMAAVGP